MKISENVWKQTLKLLDSHNCQSMIVLIISYAKTHKTILPFTSIELLNKLNVLVNQHNEENY